MGRRIQFFNLSCEVSRAKYELLSKCRDFEFQSIRNTDFSKCNFDKNVNPDVNFYSELSQESSYITDDTFVIKTQKIEGFSLIHFNCRSIKSCFEDLKDYLVSLQRHFEVICISESWLKNDDNINDYMLDNYDMVYRNRTNKRGGGVIIYVSNVLKFKLLPELSENINDVYDYISLETDTVKSRYIIITCLYRPPGTNIELFNYYLELLLGKVNQNKIFFLGRGL